MRNIKFTIAYDGTDFHGWQIQPGQGTIQGALTDILSKLTQEHIIVHGAGRTDAGVHALGQVANFKTQSQMTAAEFQRACNALIAQDIRVVTAEEVGSDFHSRWCAIAKTYRYRIYRAPVVPPFEWRYVLAYPYPLDEAAMREAAQQFVGTHDFGWFAASSGSDEEDRERTTVREIFSAGIVQSMDGQELRFEVRGRSFLRFMVRKMVGTLLDVGRGRLQPAEISRLYELGDLPQSGQTAPPQGLCMVSVEYAEQTRPRSSQPR
ncbi:MAG TPA: tRNA pseudouridine(38-40) synthase TruA [Candidatus Dormibacteraeota bacterium]|nr:tRNA pseudouridine(38-40) synthase TruA [Candidatus Dormibacteraeota bacterium]